MFEFTRSTRVLALGSILSLAIMTSPLLLASAKATPSICDAVALNIVANCGFEGGVYSSTIGSNTNTSVPNSWTPSAGYDLEAGFNHLSGVANSGSNGLSIGNDDGQPVPTLSQTLTDVLGTHYNGVIYVDYGGAGTTDPLPFFNVSIDNSPVLSLNNTAPGSYTEYTFSFTGTGSDTLSFGGNTTPDEWFVDDISVTAAPVAPTPLPAALPLFAAGLGGLGLLGWRRKRKNAAAVTAA
jgi:hypothetical protein